MLAEIVPLIIIALIFVGLIAFNRRNRDRAARADATRRDSLHPGAEVMTTSGLYGTVVSVNPEDDTALLSIARGVEVKWAIAALRQAQELPGQYRPGVGGATGNGPEESGLK
ncbi:preprotein translocase subunit YajC [Jatrophihabitans telluris]|uniref:Preprotein translocase subunit YajC n=1 Tax=Jatrophihabitans telluris TaxID=2038343 RepID=A0ABY4QUQ1_9ACTN|nr:preprotein translocase subunit YajC [Jatrophihabitans telluris]UQX86802.1 preprotein translocase subunit YajC [Jatrophihabitans telluris]